eukprot:1159948-Pelagomonas_calceolata.AAC.8
MDHANTENNKAAASILPQLSAQLHPWIMQTPRTKSSSQHFATVKCEAARWIMQHKRAERRKKSLRLQLGCVHQGKDLSPTIRAPAKIPHDRAAIPGWVQRVTSESQKRVCAAI